MPYDSSSVSAIAGLLSRSRPSWLGGGDAYLAAHTTVDRNGETLFVFVTQVADDKQSLAFLHAHDCSERTTYVVHLFADGQAHLPL